MAMSRRPSSQPLMTYSHDSSQQELSEKTRKSRVLIPTKVSKSSNQTYLSPPNSKAQRLTTVVGRIKFLSALQSTTVVNINGVTTLGLAGGFAVLSDLDVEAGEIGKSHCDCEECNECDEKCCEGKVHLLGRCCGEVEGGI